MRSYIYCVWAASSGLMGHRNWQIMCYSSPCSRAVRHVFGGFTVWLAQRWYHVCLQAVVVRLSAFIWQKSLWFALQLEKNSNACVLFKPELTWPRSHGRLKFRALCQRLFSVICRCVRSRCSHQSTGSWSWGSSSCSLAWRLWKLKTRR